MEYVDFDGDSFAVVNNEILYNSVIKCEYPYYNAEDGITKKLVYNKENYYKAIWLSTGNLIGSIAMNNTKLCTECSSYTAIVDKNSNVALYNELYKAFRIQAGITNPYDKKLNKEFYDNFEGDIRNRFKNMLKDYGFSYLKNFDEEFKKQARESLFKRNVPKFFKILQASQSAIDMPKTLAGLSEELKADIKVATDGCYKPRFLMNIDKATESEVIKFNKNNPMDEFASYVLKECLYPLKDKFYKMSIGKPNKKFYTLFGDLSKEPNEKLYKLYKQNAEFHNKNNNYTKNEKDKADAFTLLKLIYLNLDIDTIASTAYHYRFTIRFLMKFYGDVLANKLNSLESKCNDLVEDINGDIIWNGKRYKEVVKTQNSTIDFKNAHSDLIKQNVIKRVRVFNPDGIGSTIDSNIKIENGHIGDLEVIASGKDKEIICDGSYHVMYFEIDKSGVRATIYLINSDIKIISKRC